MQQPAKKTQRNPVARRRFVNEMPDRGLFIVVSMAGFAAIVSAKLNDYDAKWIAIGAVALMLVYAVIAYRMEPLRLRLDRLGDNFYYLGFIFTLASLSAALIQLQQNENVMQSILESFGIALFTTVVGIAGRVMFVQMRGEIDEIEEETRRELSQTSQELKTQLSALLADFQVLQTGMTQVSKEIISNTQSVSQESLKSIASAAESASQEIERSFAANRHVAKETADAIQQSTKATVQLIARIEAMELPSERLEKQMEELGEETNKLLHTLRLLVLEINKERQRNRWIPLDWTEKLGKYRWFQRR